jgi:dTDP-4-amino-4,6-dideoxygalactose transaminase
MEVIPFSKPFVPSSSRKLVGKSLHGAHLQGDGGHGNKAASIISELIGGGKVFLTPSCTDALMLASLVIDLKPGDEVIMPSFTFTSAALAVVNFGGTPIFVDSNLQNLCIDISDVEKKITEKTRAISWVNYGGMSSNLRELKELAARHKIFLIEDNAHSLGGTFNGDKLGSFGDLSTQSFHATKNIQCGEGGSIGVNNAVLLERLEKIREKGTDRSRYIRGEVQKYQWVEKGLSSLLAEPLAAMLLGQLQEFTRIQDRRIEVFENYLELIAKEFQELSDFVILPPTENARIAHVFPLLLPSHLRGDLIADRCRNRGVSVATHYQPLHSSQAAQKILGPQSSLPSSERIGRSLIRLPLWVGMNRKMCRKVLETLTQELN